MSPVVAQLTRELDAYLAALPAAAQVQLDRAMVPIKAQKNELLLRAGERSRFSFWINSGVVRKYYLSDGKEIVTELCFPNDLAVSFGSYVTQAVSQEFLQAVTDVRAQRLDFEAFRALSHTHAALEKLDLLLTQWYAAWLEARLVEFHTLDAAARYRKLVAEQPEVVQLIPVTYVASHLGISLETLSRIRSRMAGK